MSKIIMKVKYYLKMYLKWLLIEPKFFWFSCLLTFLPLLLFFFVSFNETNLVRIGAFFQIIGVLSIFYELYQIRQKFGFPSRLDSFRRWMNKRPKKYGSTFYIEPDGYQVSAKPLSITLTTVPHWDDKKDVEGNVKSLINWVEKNRVSIDKTNQKLRSEVSEMHNSLYKKINKSNLKIRELESNIEDSATGGLKITFIGSIWIFVGILLATIPTDLINFFKFLFFN